MRERNTPGARRLRALQDARLCQLHPEEEQKNDKRLRVVLFGTDAAREAELTSSPFFPEGPGGPREPIGPCKHQQQKNNHNMHAFDCFHNILLTLNFLKGSRRYSQENQALQAHLGVQGIPRGPVKNTDKHSYTSDTACIINHLSTEK